MASKVHGYVPGHYVSEEMICPLLYSIGIRFKSIIRFWVISMGARIVTSKRSS